MDENEFIINLKEGKTETLLFGTTKRLTKLNEPLSVSYKESSLRQVSVYKYLGVEINSKLNLNSHFDATFKRASSRLRLLQKIRPQLNLPSAKVIYQGMIIPIWTYCGVLNLNLTTTQQDRLASFHKRALKIIFVDSVPDPNFPSAVEQKKKRTCVLVRKIMDSDICDPLSGHFIRNEHGRVTRNSGYLAILPKIKTEYALRSFHFMGAKVYNELPLEIRQIGNYKDFVNKLSS
jgi:hypothetical protein